ncbi:2-phosphosulfolactate phosphatase [Brevibacillus fluminis]|uniref:Probable 2-phosphosulfolactate phosphatase n=1 Tax=Brevibacillus fluminis TaxID=511487 RepID=A0A3M8D169_9BACL|nr:2-phosphosulfolactate phosphatase [Brevibacillus fluminis]RNB81157.1 2-phosphosulfolactate phosphatase [Brevibacillus fluminis]
MKLEVVSTVEEIRSDQINNRTVIVIDVLRASTTIVTALANGFPSVIPVETIGQANLLKGSRTILVGERHCKKIADFDYNNSPTALCQAEKKDADVILTTTNGTRAIQKAERAQSLLIGCFLNATACIRHALSFHQDITLFCAGTRQEFALEDGLAAGLMAHLAKRITPALQTNDLAELMHLAYLQTAPSLAKCLRTTTTGKRLVQHNFTNDIDFCAQVDHYQLVPIVKEGRILPYLVS